MSSESDPEARVTQPDTSSQSNVPSHINSFNGLVDVIVGPQKQVFRLHKEILCNVSSYFRAALEGSFAEGFTQKIELPEDDITVFEYFRAWLYSPSSQKSLPSASEFGPYIDIDSKWLFDLYVFADMRDIPLLQNYTMDVIIWKSEWTITFTGDLIHHAYDRTPPKSPLRKFLVDWWMYYSDSTWLQEEKYGDYSKRFLFDVALANSKLGLRGRKKDHDFWKARTDYHV